ncbi:MAG: hypothetical protein COA38_19340 [Fluviicola sp.]|nr:MAG: hypothetical protein COA38_19340 [Fluviicola sp.]
MTFSQYADSVKLKMEVIANEVLMKKDSVESKQLGLPKDTVMTIDRIDIPSEEVLDKPKLEIKTRTLGTYYDRNNPPKEQDSIVSPLPVKKSKHGRIKIHTSPDAINISIDSLKYYYYGLSDVIGDTSFIAEFNSYDTEEVNNLPKEEKSRIGRKSYEAGVYEDLKIGSNNLIVVEPKVIDYGKRGINLVKSEKLENMFSEAIVEAADQAGTRVHKVDKRDLSTETYNERSTLFGFLSQLVEDDDIRPFPVDYLELREISAQYGTSDVMFTMVDHTFRGNLNPWIIGFALVVPPAFPFAMTLYLPIKLLAGNQTNLTVLIIDVESGEFKTGGVFGFHERVSKHSIGTRMYSLFKHISAQ